MGNGTAGKKYSGAKSAFSARTSGFRARADAVPVPGAATSVSPAVFPSNILSSTSEANGPPSSLTWSGTFKSGSAGSMSEERNAVSIAKRAETVTRDPFATAVPIANPAQTLRSYVRLRGKIPAWDSKRQFFAALKHARRGKRG
jgi:hypothetical protein